MKRLSIIWKQSIDVLLHTWQCQPCCGLWFWWGYDHDGISYLSFSIDEKETPRSSSEAKKSSLDLSRSRKIVSSVAYKKGENIGFQTSSAFLSKDESTIFYHFTSLIETNCRLELYSKLKKTIFGISNFQKLREFYELMFYCIHGNANHISGFDFSEDTITMGFDGFLGNEKQVGNFLACFFLTDELHDFDFLIW